VRPRPKLPTVALACVLALAGCGDRASDGAAASEERTSLPSTPGPGTEIPDDFPLSAGMGGPRDDIATSRTGTGLRDLELCGTSPLRDLGTRDRMVADNSGGESANTRELVLLGNPDEAALVARAFADLVTGCAEPGASGGMETVTEVRESPFGARPAATLLQTYTFDGEPGTGATVIHVVPVGAALLVTSTYGQWSEDDLEQALDATRGPLQGTVDALAMFADGSTPSPGAESEEPEEPAATSPGVREIPGDLPLAAGLPEDGGDFEVAAPSPDGEGMGEVEMCGRVVWPLGGTAGGTRRLVTGATGPEYFDGRELLVHSDAEAADNAMAAVRRAARECRSSGNQVWTVLDRDTGHETVTMGLTYADGLGSSVFQVTRVGQARLMVSTYGEGSLASLDAQADEVTETTGKIVRAMCVFTKTGC
jgi:hypothetical protein